MKIVAIGFKDDLYHTPLFGYVVNHTYARQTTHEVTERDCGCIVEALNRARYMIDENSWAMDRLGDTCIWKAYDIEDDGEGASMRAHEQRFDIVDGRRGREVWRTNQNGGKMAKMVTLIRN